MTDYEIDLYNQEQRAEWEAWCRENSKLARRQAAVAVLMLAGLAIELVWLLSYL